MHFLISLVMQRSLKVYLCHLLLVLYIQYTDLKISRISESAVYACEILDNSDTNAVEQTPCSKQVMHPCAFPIGTLDIT